MQPLRHNGFSMIHKALRSMLYDAAISLQHADFTNTDRTQAAFAKVERILELFDDHADHEDNHILSSVKEVNPALAEDFEQEHVKDRALCAELRAAISKYGTAAAPADMLHAGNE